MTAAILLLTAAVAFSEIQSSTGRRVVQPVAAEPAQPPTKKVQLTAERFHFTPARIRAPEGTRLEIELSSRDVEHGFQIIDTDIEVRIPASGQPIKVTFDPPSAGRYRFRCSHQCGAGHPSMTGVIVVKGERKR